MLIVASSLCCYSGTWTKVEGRDLFLPFMDLIFLIRSSMQNVLPLARVSTAALIVSWALRGEHANLLVFNDTGDH